MAPQITAWDDLIFFHEESGGETGEFRQTSFAAVDDDTAYFGKLSRPKKDITFEQVTLALAPIPDADFFPEWAASGGNLTMAPDTLPPDMYIKRPDLFLYDVFRQHNVLRLLPECLLDEARAMEVLSRHPHPHIVRYHGCRVRRGRITGLVLDRHPGTLAEYLRSSGTLADKEPFVRALASAVGHLHALGWAHNDLNPDNVLVDAAGMPVLIDFGSAREIGARLGTSRGNKEWIEGDMKDYHTSDPCHDTFAMAKIEAWMDGPTFGE